MDVFYDLYTAHFYDVATYVKQSFDYNAKGFNALQWDTAELKEIGVTSEMNYHDAFTVEEVANQLCYIHANVICNHTITG